MLNLWLSEEDISFRNFSSVVCIFRWDLGRMYEYSRKYSATSFVVITTTTTTVMATERDKGYAWVVLAASTLIMFLGPSSLTAYGNMTGSVGMNDFERIWIAVAMACFMSSTAILMGPLSELTSYRKIALLGCLLAASGFLLTGSAIESPKWFLLTLSTCVGVGLGLAVHATFLVVSFYFLRYRGLAIGIMSVSVGAGSILSPVMYDFMTSLKDRLHLRALVVTIGFMAASFYSIPPRLTRSSVSRGEGGGDNGGGEGEKPRREAIPLVVTGSDDSHEGPPLHMLHARRPSKFMEAIAATLPPIIPEDSESEDPSKCPSSVEDEDEYEDTPSQTTVSSTKSVENGVCGHLHLELPHNNHHHQIDNTDANKNCPKLHDGPPFKDTMKLNHVAEESTVTTEKSDNGSAPRSLPLNLQLLGNPKFLNMAILTSLVMITVPNFPIVLYACVTGIQEKKKSGGGDGDDNEGDFVMYLMFSLDLASRLLTSYLSDFAFFNRRLAFLCGATVGAIIISVVGSVEDIRVIYALSALYGISSGILAVTESLMFADVFGMEQFPSVYGLVGLCKALLVLIISTAFHSPSASFVYIMDPMLHPKVNDTICTNCDPLNIFPTDSDPIADQLHRRSLLHLISIPGYLCTAAWCGEYLVSFILSRRSSSSSAATKGETQVKTATPV